MDRRTEFSSQDRVCIPRSVVKMTEHDKNANIPPKHTMISILNK